VEIAAVEPSSAIPEQGPQQPIFLETAPQAPDPIAASIAVPVAVAALPPTLNLESAPFNNSCPPPNVSTPLTEPVLTLTTATPEEPPLVEATVKPLVETTPLVAMMGVQKPLPASSPAAIAAHFSALPKPTAPAGGLATTLMEPTQPNLAFQPFKEKANDVILSTVPSNLPPVPTDAVNSKMELWPVQAEEFSANSIAPFPTEELAAPAPPTVAPEQAPVTTPIFNQAKTIPPSVTGLVTWRFETTPKSEEPAIPDKPSSHSPSQPTPADVLAETAPDTEMNEPLEDLPEEDYTTAPTLNVDLTRLTTSDSLFSRRPRTITIRNR
jgi:hypothetical protein